MAKSSNMMTEVIQCRLDAETAGRFKELADKERRPPSQMLRILIEQFVESAKGNGKRRAGELLSRA